MASARRSWNDSGPRHRRRRDAGTGDDVEKAIEQLRIEDRADFTLHDRKRLASGKSLPIRPVTREGVEDVGNAEDAGGQRDRLAAELIRIAAPVPSLVVTTNHRQDVPRAFDALEQFCPGGSV